MIRTTSSTPVLVAISGALVSLLAYQLYKVIRHEDRMAALATAVVVGVTHGTDEGREGQQAEENAGTEEDGSEGHSGLSEESDHAETDSGRND